MARPPGRGGVAVRPPRRRRRRRHGSVLFGAVIAAAALLLGDPPARAVDFELSLPPVSDYFLDDHGVADIDGDGNLDIFTTNHNAQHWLSMGLGDGRFANVDAESVGLVQNPAAPGLVDSPKGPDVAAGGLYVYLKKKRLYIRRVGLSHLGEIRGALFMGYRPAVSGHGFSRETVCGNARRHPCRLDFVFHGPGMMRVKTNLFQRPKRLTLDERIPLDRVFLGSVVANPASHDLTLRVMDRHAMAWSDFDDDGHLDVFISNGAAKGRLGEIRADFPELPYLHELFCQRRGVFRRCERVTGLGRGEDRGRGAAWVDFNGSGRLDLYLNNHLTPNRLFKRKPHREFVDRASARNLSMDRSGPFVWFDADNDSDADLLIAEHRDLVLYRRGDDRYVRTVVGPYLGGYAVSGRGKISLFDLGDDGYLDATVASPKGSSLILNDRGRLSAQPAGHYGLPAQSFALDFVDVDNDGRPEVHAASRNCASDGLYALGPALRFTRRDDLPALRRDCNPVTRSLWFDADNNGFPDLLMSHKTPAEGPRVWRTVLLRNAGNDNHWLQVVLRGNRGNREALGARVALTAGGRTRHAQTGQFEGSAYSQGHYRLYFGLGDADSVDRIEVFWPDGARTTLTGIRADRLVRIEQDAG